MTLFMIASLFKANVNLSFFIFQNGKWLDKYETLCACVRACISLFFYETFTAR